MSKANKTQVGGMHYVSSIQHWDFVWANNLDYFQAQITKYVSRCKKKNGVQDLEKAQHFLEKYIELMTDVEMRCNCGYPGAHTPGCPMYRPAEELTEGEATKGYVNQD